MLDADTVSFVHARPRLFGIARRVLGSAADADDIVQEAWIRWQESDRSLVRDPAAFLATTTTRLALNVGQSARVAARDGLRAAPRRRWSTRRADPVLGAEQREALARALWTVLETLSPTERAVYVLREAFDYPHRRIAEVARPQRGQRPPARDPRPPPHRGRAALDGRPAEHERLVDAFIAAAQTGDLDRARATAGREEGTDARIAA